MKTRNKINLLILTFIPLLAWSVFFVIFFAKFDFAQKSIIFLFLFLYFVCLFFISKKITGPIENLQIAMENMQKIKEYSNKPKLRQEITERFMQKINLINKESSEIEQQIKKLESAI